MRKKILKIIISIVLTIVFLCSVAVVSYTYNYYRGESGFITNSENCKTIDASKNLHSISEIDIERHKAEINKAFELLPDNITKSIPDRWTIVLSDKFINIGQNSIQDYIDNLDISEEDKQMLRVGGQTITPYKVIVLYTYAEDNRENEFLVSVIHEIGHAVSYEYGNMERDKELLSLYNKYINSYEPIDESTIKEYASLNSAEFFACVFVDYVLHQEELKQQYFDLYEYMSQIEKLPSDMNFLNELKFGFKALLKVQKGDFDFEGVVNTTN